MSTTLSTANKIVLNNIELQEKTAYNPGRVEPDAGYSGLSVVNVVGGGILTVNHTFAKDRNAHTFTLSDEDVDLKLYTSKIVLDIESFAADFTIGDTLFIVDNKSHSLECAASSWDGEAFTGIFKSGEPGLIEVSIPEKKAIISSKYGKPIPSNSLSETTMVPGYVYKYIGDSDKNFTKDYYYILDSDKTN